MGKKRDSCSCTDCKYCNVNAFALVSIFFWLLYMFNNEVRSFLGEELNYQGGNSRLLVAK